VENKTDVLDDSDSGTAVEPRHASEVRGSSPVTSCSKDYRQRLCAEQLI
jgi:hypothetical protein